MIQVGKGTLTLGHRPKMKAMYGFPESYDRVVTLLSKYEDPDSIKYRCRSINIKWTHLPLLHVLKENPRTVAEYAHTVYEFLQAGERVYLHCSAGIHRTGYVAYLVLCEAGYSKDHALNIICTERPIAADEYHRFLLGK